MAYGTINADLIATSTTGGTLGAGDATGFKNRIINGAMMIDQRNAGASTTPSTSQTYNLDRWRAVFSQASKYSIQQNAGSVTPPVGFKNYLGATVVSAATVGSSDYFQITQSIEGLNVADLGWGTINAKTVTFSFWVYSSLTGTFGGNFGNADGTRSYPYSYTISSPNTWEYKTITIAGDTTGTWLTTNGLGINIIFSLGAGSTYQGTAGSWAATNYVSCTGATNVVATNGATFYITGVQLEVGPSASSFEVRDYGRELILCQRYYQSLLSPTFKGVCNGTTALNRIGFPLSVTMRTNPTPTIVGTMNWYDGGGVGTFTSVLANYSGPQFVEIDASAATGSSSTYRPITSYQSSGVLTLSSEL